jgi:uncharacterized metal-binding protein
MPSGKTHDAITFLCAAPVFAGAYLLTRDPVSAVVVAACFLFGGIMFGPDLDTVSSHYSRWGTFRFLWLPYQKFFPHRSRWSHGLVFGTFFRVVYFCGALTLGSFGAAYLLAVYSGGDLPRFAEFLASWQEIGIFLRRNLGELVFFEIFAGLWFGAASHTVTDMAGSFVKTGRVGEFL